MANREHLVILRHGVDIWNRWRQEAPDIEPDFCGADLHNADLRQANLRHADFGWGRGNIGDALLSSVGGRQVSAALRGTNKRANPRGADLSGADLEMACLRGATLSGADLCEANLCRTDLAGADLSWAECHGTNFSGADLRGAHLMSTHLCGSNLHGANLSAANMYNANLFGADLKNARIGWTVFAGIDLSSARGLDTVVHDGPSTIDIDTLHLSGGNIPEAFLRGCGVPDIMVAFVRSLVGKAIEYYSCFISHSSYDQAFADRLHADLQAAGVRCWFAPHDLKIGDRFRQRVDEAIRVHDKLLLILSEHSVESDWVATEVEAAFEKERQRAQSVLFPVRIDDPVMVTNQAWAADIRRTRHIGDFTRWKDHDAYTTAFDRLLSDLKAQKA